MNTPLHSEEPEKSAPLVLGRRTDNYIAKAILLEEAAPPVYWQSTVKLIAYSLVVFIVWAMFAKLDVVATAPGQVIPIQGVKIIQHVDGGRIAAIEVRDGQEVKEGEVLMRLNDTEASAEYQTLSAKYWSLFARVERLRALLDKRPANFSSVPAQYQKIVAEQQFTLKTSSDQIKQLEAEIELLGEVSSIRGSLAKEKLATRVQALDAERNFSQAQAELLRYRRANMDELNLSSGEFAQTEEQMIKLRDRLERVNVVSPADGVIQDLRFRTIGGVIPPGAILMNVVPLDGKVHAELRVQPTDIGFVKTGEDARLKIGTYDFMRYGTVTGKVNVSIPQNYVGDRDKGIDPGMTVQADIITDRQSVLRYLLRPIYVAFSQGLRER